MKEMKEIKNENYNELKKYYKIKENIGKNWKSTVSQLFLIDKQWYYSWKKYVNKEFFDENYQLNPNKKKRNENEDENEEKKNLIWIENPSPGPISNNKIILDINSFYNNGDINNPENYIIKQDLSFKKDIKMIHEELWNFYFNIFGGGPRLCLILNDNYKNSNNKDSLFQLNKTEIKLIFLTEKNEIIGNDEKINEYFSVENVKSIFIEKNKLIIDLIKKIVEIENQNLKNKKNNHYGEKINIKEIQLWFIYLSDFNIKNLNLLMKENYGKEALNKVLERNNNNLKQSKSYLIRKKIDNLFFSPKELKYYCEIDKAYIEDVFPDSSKQKALIFIERKELNYFLETKYKDGNCSFCQKTSKLFYFCSCKNKWYCSKKCLDRNFNNHYSECPNNCLDIDPIEKNIFSVMSICGLRNVGNTCYINTAIQCLNSCWELTNFFLKKNIKNYINKDNPLGYKGILCKSYSNLIHHLWYGASNVYNPYVFCSIIGHLNNVFSGKNQQDAQEFLNFLIDGLHEDLNLVINKPSIKEEKIKNERDKSKIEWLNYKRRNQSVLIKLFYGQFLSKINCPNQDCQSTIIKFEPFMSISVPLTLQSKKLEVKCFFIFYYTNIKPILLLLSFNNDCTIMALRNKISKILNVHPFSFVICKLDSTGNIKYYANCSQQISTTSKGEYHNEKPYFLMQLDPEIFNDPKNNYYKNLKNYQQKNFEKLNDYVQKNSDKIEELFDNDYIEDENGNPNNENSPISYYQQNNDEESTKSNKACNTSDKNELSFGNIIVENYGLNSNFILVPLFINQYREKNFEKPEFLMLPRILLLKKDITCKEIHKLIFKIFNSIIDQIYGKKKDFKSVFNNLSTDMANDYNKNDTFDFQYSRKYPYRLRIVNINKKEINIRKGYNKDLKPNNEEFNLNCLICGKLNCRNCLLPYKSDKKLLDFIDKIYPRNHRNKTVDGTFYFLNANQRKLIDYQNNDFQLEMTWLENYKDNIFKIMNDFENLNFKSSDKKNNKSISLLKCFEYFMRWEKLENYSYKCEICKTDKNAYKKIQIYKCPYYLIIHLKRFIDEKTKINTEVKFPIRGLDLNNYVKNNEDTIEKIYDLRCIMYHSGELGYGHYYAICYNTIHNKWFIYNDDKVNEIKESEISTKDAYVLFYRRRGMENMIDLEKLYMKKFKDYSEKINSIKNTNTKNKEKNN